MTYSNHSRPEIMLPGEMIIIFSLATRYCSIKISNEKHLHHDRGNVG